MTTPTDASYATEIARLLWPAPWSEPTLDRTRPTAGADREAYVFPNARRPRLLVPTDVPAAATMVRRLSNGRGVLAGPAGRLLEGAVRSRVMSRTRWPLLRVAAAEAGADSVERHLSASFGTDVRVGVILGTRRVNQKPVLQVFDRGGRLLGFAKVGHNPLTAALVRREAASLSVVAAARPRSFRVPTLVDHGQWNGLEVLVMSALRTHDRPVPVEVREEAMRETARLTGSDESTLTTSSFWARLEHEATRLADRPHGPRLLAAVEEIRHIHRDHDVELGCWHGDWGHWNMGLGDHVLQVWDWERFDAAVPVGFDALHFAAQFVRPHEREAARQEAVFLDSVGPALDGLRVPADRHDLTLRLYLLEVATRYVDSLTHGETAPLRRRTDWVLTLLERLLTQTQPALAEGRP